MQTVTKYLEQYVEEVLRQAAAQLQDHPEQPKLPLVSTPATRLYAQSRCSLCAAGHAVLRTVTATAKLPLVSLAARMAARF